MAANSGGSAKKPRGPGRPFKPGKSGNPSGRPKKTKEQKDALEKIRALAPDAADVLIEIMRNPGAPENARIKCAEMILDRAYGKPETGVKADIKLTEGDFVLRIAGDDDSADN